MKMTLFSIAGTDINKNDDGSLTWLAPMMIDDDGSGPSFNDPDYQNDTSLHHNGIPLDATKVRYIVVPPQVIKCVNPIVLGCKGTAKNTKTGAIVDVVVGDVGPHSKIGEASMATAKALGIPNSPTEGGEEAHIILYTIYPGIPAELDGIIYELQAYEAD